MSLLDAERRARRIYKSKGFRAAYVRGAAAAIAGRSTSSCPYKPDREKTWRLTWRLAWMRGYASEGGGDSIDDHGR